MRKGLNVSSGLKVASESPGVQKPRAWKSMLQLVVRFPALVVPPPSWVSVPICAKFSGKSICYSFRPNSAYPFHWVRPERPRLVVM